MKLESGWRYGNPGPISPHAVNAFSELIAKIAAQGQRWGIFEGFKKLFAGVGGRSYGRRKRPAERAARFHQFPRNRTTLIPI